MKYASIFATILFIWIAVIIMAATTTDAKQIYGLYLASLISTLALFVIGFARK
ncbi:MAG TPA: hypothetical protein VFH39_02330 [Candidatus Saccharimonadales bacterium]|nr:hypothetical protein [Candidatus Saccharimonadales bacterium]